jgi:hypothetical protein
LIVQELNTAMCVIVKAAFFRVIARPQTVAIHAWIAALRSQ